MNKFAYYMSGYAFKAFSGISKARINVHGEDNIPKGEGSIIFTANHFTRIETVFLPYHIHQITNKPVWSLAAAELFQGGLKGILEAMGAVSTRDPQRDFLIVKSLINNQADCVIFPEGMMVKNKKITSDGDFKIIEDGHVQRPRTGAATLALQTEFYRERLRRMIIININEFNRLVNEYEISSPKDVMDQETFIVPVNITYYPVRAKENLLSRMALNMIENPSKRMMEELLTEGTMIFSGVDVDIRFGTPINIRNNVNKSVKKYGSLSLDDQCSTCGKEHDSESSKDYFFNSFVESDLNSRRKIQFSNRLCSHHVMRSSSYELMKRYMKSVYDMTTLNYDHIFATILKYMPNTYQKHIHDANEGIVHEIITQEAHKGIDQYDLKCRAFLATFACEMSLHCNFHKSLYSNQTHILTDDRFHRYEDFITLAIETGVVEEKDGRLYRNEKRLGAHYLDEMQYEFHTVRVDNPISVIANEVEPLAKLQAYFADLAMKLPSEIDLMMSYRIEDKQYNSYLNDFTKYVRTLPILNPFHEIDSFSDDYNRGRPRLLKSDSDDIGVLLIHDFLSSPEELIECADYLHSRGFNVYIPRLPGHGTAPENLTETEFIQWIEAVEEGFVLLRSLCKKKVVGGLGLGGILGLALQFHVTDINAIFLVAPPRIIKDYPHEFITYSGLWSLMIKRAISTKGDKNEWITYLPESSKFRYSTHPVSVVKQIDKLLEHVENGIKEMEKNLEKQQDEKKEKHQVSFSYKDDSYKDTLKEQLGTNILKYFYAKQPAILNSLLIVQSRNNPFINPRGAQKLFDMIPATKKEYYIFDLHSHVMLRGEENVRISRAIADYIESV